MTIRVRMAPSPTGNDVHIGNLYTALVNWAFAKKNKGKFIIRIEDTDRTRYIEGAEQKILETFKKYGLDYDEGPDKEGSYGPYRQSERLHLYKKYAEELINKGLAYYCTCSKERLEQVRKEQTAKKLIPKYDRQCLKNQKQVAAEVKAGKSFVIRLKIPDSQQITFTDLIRGKIAFNSGDMDDQVLLKSDGYPTYHLAVVIDDYLMAISHVIRAEEWISSTPKHILLYNAFGWEKPTYCHVPLLRNPDRSKLSKRKNPVWASWYLDQGYLPKAMLNYLCLMGWSHPQEKTIFPLTEFIKYLDLKDISPAGPIFDPKKLDYVNGVYIRNTSDKNLIQLIKSHLSFKLSSTELQKIIPLVKERMNKLTDVNNLVDFFVKDIPYDKELLLKKADIQLVKQQLKLITNHLSLITTWSLANITKSMQTLCEGHQWNRSQFFMLLRVAVTGKTITPPLFESMEILGKDKTLQRIKLALQKVQ